jgi:hypothetical protein
MDGCGNILPGSAAPRAPSQCHGFKPSEVGLSGNEKKKESAKNIWNAKRTEKKIEQQPNEQSAGH